MEQLYKAFSDGIWWFSDDEAYTLKQYSDGLYLCEDENFYNNKDSNLVKIGKAIPVTNNKE